MSIKRRLDALEKQQPMQEHYVVSPVPKDQPYEEPVTVTVEEWQRRHCE